MLTSPWHGILVATALPLRADTALLLRADLGVDLDAYADHVRWLLANGRRGR
jgi:4-hydroxy-tetrahydrodipicolinate synthase